MSQYNLGARKVKLFQMAMLLFITSKFSAQDYNSTSMSQDFSQIPTDDDASYSELRELGPNCSPQDTCNSTRDSDTILKSMCHCGMNCRQLDTCCLDSKFRHQPLDPEEIPHKCMPEYKNEGSLYFMINRCKRGWSASAYVRAMCLGDGELLSDPMMLIPVTNIEKRRTYKNIYCAACNNETWNTITFWNLYAFHVIQNDEIQFLSDMQLKKLRFDPKKYFNYTEPEFQMPSWEIAGDDINNKVLLQVDLPSELSAHVEPCLKMASTCARNWTDDVMRRKCESYMAHVHVRGDNSTRYRNIHCALCNFQDPEKLVCLGHTEVTRSRGKLAFNFGRLLDVNQSGGDKVGKKRMCKETELYHPVKQECVPLAGCIAGYVFKDGVCVKAD